MSSFVAGMMLVAASIQATPLETGTVLFLKHSNKLVAHWTDADVTHVALAVQRGGETWVYEAAPGEVRRLLLTDYCQELAQQNRSRSKPIELWMMPPRRTWTDSEQAAVTRFLDAQLGRRYSIRDYVRKREGDGMHCAELAASALQQTGRYRFAPPYRFTPAALCKILAHSYVPPRAVPLEPGPVEAAWCQRTWNRCLSWADWCSWSCHETWTFCW